MVMLTTSYTSSTGMLTVLSNTTVTGRDVTSLFSVFMKTGRLKRRIEVC